MQALYELFTVTGGTLLLLIAAGRIRLAAERKDLPGEKEVQTTLTSHYCVWCRRRWYCAEVGCRAKFECLCSKCDRREVREKLGGEWNQ